MLLGSLLLHADRITQSQLREALLLQKRLGEKLASVLVRQGVLTEKLAVMFLGRQLDVLGVDLSTQTLDLQLFERLPLELCDEKLLFPLRFENGWLLVAMCDPRDTALVQKIEARGVRVAACVALEVSLRHALAEARVALAMGLTKITPDAQRDIEPAEIETLSEAPLARPEARAFDARVLLVDPDAKRRAATESMLAGSGRVQVVATSNAGDALELSARGVDLVLVDATAPEFAAFDLCRRLRLQRPGVPVFLTSGRPRGWRFAQDVRAALGVAGYLEEPYAPSELVGRLRAILKLSPVVARDLAAGVRKTLEEGREALRRNALRDAEAAFLRGLALVPASDLLRYHLGETYERQGRPFDAIDQFEEALRRNPEHSEALKRLARLYQVSGFGSQARETWQRAAHALELQQSA